MCVKSGYKAVSGIQLLNALALIRLKGRGAKLARVYFATFAALAVREAAGRAKIRHAGRGAFTPHYTIAELARLTGLLPGQVRRCLKQLTNEGLLSFSESQICHTDRLLAKAEPFYSLVRSPRRPVPVPRAVLRFLAAKNPRSIAAVMLAYMLRGLTISKTSGEISGRGSSKLSWISAVAGTSERGAAYARKWLISRGWLSADSGSSQWKLNRHGAYFVINVDWTAPAARTKIAARQQPKRGLFAPPNKNLKTPNGSKNQKPFSAGFSNEGEEAEANWRNVRPTDLFRLSRCEALYWQAVEVGDLSHSDHNALNFLAAAIRARSITARTPEKLFVAIVKRALWHHVSFEQEEAARKALSRYREAKPQAFRDPQVSLAA